MRNRLRKTSLRLVFFVWILALYAFPSGAGEGESDKDNICPGMGRSRQKETLRNKHVVTWIKNNAFAIESLGASDNFDDLHKFGEMIGKARIVALGEATHSTSEFFTIRHRLIRYLVLEKGFNLLGIECSWPQAEHINKYILTGEGNPRQLLSNLHFWWTNTEEMLDIINWMREYNKKADSAVKIRFYGLDFQYHYGAIDKVIDYLKRVDKDAVEKVESLLAPYIMFSGKVSGDGWNFRSERRYRTITNYWYLSQDEKKFCREKLQAVYDFFVKNRTKYEGIDSRKGFVHALQNVNIILQAEERYANVKPFRGHGHYRDLFMAENAKWVLDFYGSDSKMILWSHNYHISDYEETLGGYLRKEYGNDLRIVALTCYSGAFNVTMPTDSPDADFGRTRPMPCELAVPTYGSFEDILHSTGYSQFYIDLRPLRNDNDSEVTDFFNQEISVLDLGTSYNPKTGYSFYDVHIPEIYDLVIFIDKTKPTKLLPLLPVSKK